MPDPTPAPNEKVAGSKATGTAKPKPTLPPGTFELRRRKEVTGTNLAAVIGETKKRQSFTFGTTVGVVGSKGHHQFVGHKRFTEGDKAGTYDTSTALVVPEGSATDTHLQVEVPTNDLFDVTLAEQIADEKFPKEKPEAKTEGATGAAVVAVLAALLCMFANTACESTANGTQIKGSAAAKIRDVVTLTEPEVRPLSAVATDGVFALLPASDRASALPVLRQVSAAVAAFGSGTPDQFQAAITAVLPTTPQYANLAPTLTHIYQLAYNTLNGDPKLLVKLIGDVAGGISDSCNAWANIKTADAWMAKRLEYAYMVRNLPVAAPPRRRS